MSAPVAAPATCVSKECGLAAAFEPTVKVWAAPWARPDRAANFQLEGFGLCGGCRDEAKLDDLIDEAGRKRIDEAFVAQGKALPDWSTVKLEWREIA